MKLLKSLFLEYQKAMWYMALFAGEYTKAGRFINDVLLLTTFLAVRGVRLSLGVILLLYLGLMVVAVTIGIFLDRLRVPHFVNQFGNKRNPELMEILERLERIEQQLKKTP